MKQIDLKANEVRLAEMNEMAMTLVSLGQTEAAYRIQGQLEDLNKKWANLQTQTGNQMAVFERAHEVQRFHRDGLKDRAVSVNSWNGEY